MHLTLKQKSFLFVAVSVLVLVAVYAFFSTQFVRQSTNNLLAEREARTVAIKEDIDEFLRRGSAKLESAAEFPLLVNGMESVQADRLGGQIAASESLHYFFLQSEVFQDGVFLLNAHGQVLWSEPPDQSLLDTTYAPFETIKKGLTLEREHPYVLTVSTESRNPEILLSQPITDRNDNMVGMLVGAISVHHQVLNAAIAHQTVDDSAAQVVDESGMVIASTDASRVLRQLPYREFVLNAIRTDGSGTLNRNAPGLTESVVAFARMSAAPWTVTLDQAEVIALADAHRLQMTLTVFGIVFIALAMAILIFVVRSFAGPIELITADARLIAAGDLNVRFTSGRTDEIGILASALDDMKMKLKHSYERLLQSEKMALMGQVVAGIAHELNNPLTIVMGHTELMLHETVDDRLKQPLSRVHDGAQRASKIVRNLLTFARQQKPERKPTDINAVILKTVELRAYELKVNNIELITDLAPIPQTLADAHQLQQVFLNLIVNAEHAMLESRGKGRLTIRSHAVDNHIEISFHDDGPGIPEENLRRIFDPFFTTKAVGKGTGLGLSICQGIVAEHSGRIAAFSTPGHGSRFTVELPVVETVSVAADNIRSAPAAFAGQKRVMVIDDEGHLRELLQKILTQDGHQIFTASNGKEAMQMLQQREFDLIISDIKMPNTDGREMYQLLKARGSQYAERMLFITGDLMNPETLRFLESTGNPWLAKPFQLDAVRLAVGKALAIKRP